MKRYFTPSSTLRRGISDGHNHVQHQIGSCSDVDPTLATVQIIALTGRADTVFGEACARSRFFAAEVPCTALIGRPRNSKICCRIASKPDPYSTGTMEVIGRR